MIGQPGAVGEKVKKLAVTPMAYIMSETQSFWIIHTFVSVLSKGEDGEAGDPGPVGFPGKIVSLFSPFWEHMIVIASSGFLQLQVLSLCSFSPLLL